MTSRFSPRSPEKEKRLIIFAYSQGKSSKPPFLARAPFRCPVCRGDFEVPNSGVQGMPDHFTSLLVPNPADAEIDPNNFLCEACEDNPAKYLCQECSQFYCEPCRRAHTKMRATASHLMLSLQEAFDVTTLTKSKLPRCPFHVHQEINAFCAPCKEAVCVECAVDAHSGHAINRLNAVVPGFRDDITARLNATKRSETHLAKTVLEANEIMAYVNQQAKTATDQINDKFNKLRELIEDRRVHLLSEVEKGRHLREKGLRIQREAFDFMLGGLRQANAFGASLLKNGTDVDIALGHKMIMTRCRTLEREAENCRLDPGTGAPISIGGEDEVSGLMKSIAALGSVQTHHLSVENFSITTREDIGSTVQVEREYVFCVNMGGENAIKSLGNVQEAPFQVDITDGPSKPRVTITPSKDDKATFDIKFTPTMAGLYVVSVTYRGQNLPNSPLKIQVVKEPVYRRHYPDVKNYTLRFRDRGSGDGQFDKPCSVAVNFKGDIVVADTFNHRVQIFDKTGKFLFRFGSHGGGNGQFHLPVCVLVSPKGDIIVADTANHRIQIFDAKGIFLRSIGMPGKGDGQFNAPHGLCIDKSGHLVVADRGNNRLQWFNTSGQFVRSFGGGEKSPLSGPTGLGMLSNGDLVISERNTSKLIAFDRNKMERKWAVEGGFNNPFHVFVDSDDNVLVADCNNHKVQVFKSNGMPLTTIGDETTLIAPTGVCLDPEGRIIVCEQQGFRITVY